MRKILTLVLALIVAMLPLAALGEATPAPEAAPAEAAAATEAAPVEAATATETAPVEAATPAPTTDPNKIVATVDGDSILYSSVTEYFQVFASQYSAYLDVNDAQIQALLMNQALDYAIQLKLMEHKATELGYDKMTDEEAAAIEKKATDTYNGYIETYASYFTQSGATAEDAKKQAEEYLTSAGYPLDKFKEQYKKNELLSRVQKSVIDTVTVSDEDVKADYDSKVASQKESYDKNPASYCNTAVSGGKAYYVPAGVRAVKHILITPENLTEINDLKTKIADAATAEADKATAQTQLDALIKASTTKVDEVVAKIKAGEDFQSLIDAYGEDPGMKAGAANAEKGYYICEGASYDEAFLKAAMALKGVGDISDPVLGSYGYHIIRYESDVTPGPVAFESVKETIAADALTTAQNTAFENALAEWKTAAKVENFGL